jgi:general stress protein CsbA
MSDDAIGRLPFEAVVFLVVSAAVATGLYALVSRFVVFRATAVPALFAASETLGLGANGWLVVSYAVGLLVGYLVAYRGGLAWLRSRFS